MVDLFGPVTPGPDPMPAHTITVTKVEYDEPGAADVFGIDPVELEYEIDHGACELRGDDCLVEQSAHEGLHAALFGVWDKDHRVEAKAYRVRGWVSVSPATPNGPEEYDAGIEEVDGNDDDDI